MVVADTMKTAVVANKSVVLSTKTPKEAAKKKDLLEIEFIKNEKEKERITRGIVYLGHIPHGFNEEAMQAYFSQFGKITRLRLARSKQTGRPKGYAYIEFLDVDVAKEVAEAMNNYLMFNHILQCSVVPKKKISAHRFLSWIRKKEPVPNYVKAREKHNRQKEESAAAECVKRLVSKVRRTKNRLAALGIKFSLDKLVKQTSATTNELEEKQVKETITKKTIATKTNELEEKQVKQTVAKEATEKSNERKEKHVKKVPKKKRRVSKGNPVVLDPTETEITFKVPPQTAIVFQTRKRKRADST